MKVLEKDFYDDNETVDEYLLNNDMVMGRRITNDGWVQYWYVMWIDKSIPNITMLTYIPERDTNELWEHCTVKTKALYPLEDNWIEKEMLLRLCQVQQVDSETSAYDRAMQLLK